MIWDGKCGFCRFWVEKWAARLKGQVDFKPSQEFENLPNGVTREDVESAVILVEPNGHVSKGAEAVFRTLSMGEGTKWPLTAYESIPGARTLSDVAYKVVASNRPFFSKITKTFFGKK